LDFFLIDGKVPSLNRPEMMITNPNTKSNSPIGMEITSLILTQIIFDFFAMNINPVYQGALVCDGLKEFVVVGELVLDPRPVTGCQYNRPRRAAFYSHT
jgi:hypothetical protein